MRVITGPYKAMFVLVVRRTWADLNLVYLTDDELALRVIELVFRNFEVELYKWIRKWVTKLKEAAYRSRAFANTAS